MNDRLEKILFSMFDDLIKGVDQYNHQGSLWLILTDERKWILEFTKTKTLWYNYTIFKDRMSFAAMDCVENKEYITKWFESRFLNKPKAQDTLKRPRKLVQQVEDAIENGVKHINELSGMLIVDDVIQDGVKDTEIGWVKQYNEVEDTIRNGVKHTSSGPYLSSEDVEYTIQNGVKETKEISNISLMSEIFKIKTKQVIRDCVQETIDLEMDDEEVVEYFIQNSVKESLSTAGKPLKVEDTIQNGVKQTKRSYNGSRKQRTTYVIENGVRYTDYIMYRDNDAVKYTIQNGVRHTMWSSDDDDVEDAIENGVKLTSCANSNTPSKIEETIENGVKLTLGERMNRDYSVKDIVENEVKETELHKGNRPLAIRDAIKNGVKN